MRRSTPGAFSSIEPHTPRVCGPQPNPAFHTSGEESGRCVPPPVPTRTQPPPLPPRHHMRKPVRVELGKYKEPLPPEESIGLDVYESISEAQVSTRSTRALPRSYGRRDYTSSNYFAKRGLRSTSPHTMQLSCLGTNVPGQAYGNTRAFTTPYSSNFTVDPNAEIPRGPCTCNLGGVAKQSASGSSQSPVWSKMVPAESVPYMRSQPTPEHPLSANATCGSEPNILDKKSSNEEGRFWTMSRLSRTMSRFFRKKSANRKSKRETLRSRSVYFPELADRTAEAPPPIPPVSTFLLCPLC